MLSKVSVRRLTKLRDYMLHNVPDEKFNYAHWVSERPTGDCPLVGVVKVPAPSCGYVACLGGHACSIPSFRKAGLKLGLRYGKLIPHFTEDGVLFTYDEALARFFRISAEQAEYLFIPESINTPSCLSCFATRMELIDHLTKFIASGGELPE